MLGNLLGPLVELPVLMHGKPDKIAVRAGALGVMFPFMPHPEIAGRTLIDIYHTNYTINMSYDDVKAIAMSVDGANTF